MNFTDNDPCYAISIRRVAHAVTAVYDRKLSAVGLTLNQYSLIRSISNLETCTMNQLADYVGLERTTLTRTLKPLLAQGFIVDMARPGSRSRKLCLSQQGKEKLQEGYPYWEEAQEEVESVLGESKASLLLYLSKVI